MKAIAHSHYGPPSVLRVEERDSPSIGSGDVLVRVKAVSLNPLDWHFLRGEPFPIRLALGLRKPGAQRLGVDFAGTVEKVGAGVTQFKPGDSVYGGRPGALAEYLSVPERIVLSMPANLTFQQAAAVPVAALTALQGLRDKGRLQAGQSVLVNGASGGVGTFAIPIAKHLGAEVTGVCSGRNVELVRSLGADFVVDYSREDFTVGGGRYDVLLDCVGNRSLTDCRRVLKPTGTYVMVGGPGGRWLGPLARSIRIVLWSPFVRQRLVTFITSARRDDLQFITGLIEAGKVAPVIDRCYPLEDVSDAFAYLEEGHARGKVVIRLDPDSSS